MKCNKIDKPLVVYSFLVKRYDVHNNVAYILKKLIFFLLQKGDFRVI